MLRQSFRIAQRHGQTCCSGYYALQAMLRSKQLRSLRVLGDVPRGQLDKVRRQLGLWESESEDVLSRDTTPVKHLHSPVDDASKQQRSPGVLRWAATSEEFTVARGGADQRQRVQREPIPVLEGKARRAKAPTPARPAQTAYRGRPAPLRAEPRVSYRRWAPCAPRLAAFVIQFVPSCPLGDGPYPSKYPREEVAP